MLRTALVVLALSGAAAAWGQQPASAGARAAAKRCHAPHASIDDCDDAIRWNPRDPGLLISMGDTQMRAGRPADAARAYRRAAVLAPGTPGLQQKINNADAAFTRSRAGASRNAAAAAAAKHFSNVDPDSQSH